MKVLAVTNMFPTPQSSRSGRFIEQQLEGLKLIGLDIELLFVDRVRKGMRAYATLPGELQSKIKACQPDLVHAHYGGVMADVVTRTVQDRPTIVTFHGSDLLGQPYERLLRRMLSSYGVFASRKAARRCDGLVVVAEHLRRVLPKDVKNSKVRVIPCGIDINLFKPLSRAQCCKKLGWDPEVFHVLFQDSGDPVKRPSLANESVQALKNSGVKCELHVFRNVPYAEVPTWINASDVLLLTSIHEGSPTVVKEALACNLPIVSVDVGDVRERIEGIEGCYIARPEPHYLGATLGLVASSAERIDGRPAVQRLSLDHIAIRLADFYREVLGSYAATRRPATAESGERVAGSAQ
jgi:glycosyltransferase involved in cell wall biosynthesis